MRRALWSVAIGFVLGLAVLVGFTLWHVRAPLLRALPAREPGTAEARGPGPERADLHLVLPDGAGAPHGTTAFDDLDLSAGWINILAQEAGAFLVRRIGDGLPGGREAPPVLVLSRGAARGADAPMAASLEAAAGSGSLVVLDRPPPALFGLAGFLPDPAGGTQRADRPAAAPGPIGAGEAQRLATLDVPVELLAGSPAGGVEVLLRMGDAPAVLRRRVGEGAVIAFLFDLARLVTSLQQGTPEPDLSVANRYPDRLADLVESNDLVASPSLLDNDIPFADILERLAVAWVEEVRPVPAWWGYPDGAAGAFVMTHDDEGFGDPSRWMTEHEASVGAVSTSFFMPSGSLTAPGLARMIADGTEVGIHWDRTATDHAVDDFMLGPLRAFRVEKSLTKQITWLRALLPGEGPVRASRAHFLQWGATWAETFQELAAADIDIDSTYGVDYGTRGYLFGTGRPFRPLDENGQPFPLLEVPHLGSENLGGFDAAYLAHLLEESRDTYHQAINVLFHPIDMGWIPSVDLYRHWKRSYEIAKEREHHVMTLGQLHDFEALRATSPLTSTWDGSVLRIRGEARGKGMSVVVPGSAGGAALSAVGDGRAAVPHRRIGRMGIDATVVAVPRGPFALEVSYGEAR